MPLKFRRNIRVDGYVMNFADACVWVMLREELNFGEEIYWVSVAVIHLIVISVDPMLLIID